MNLSFSKQEQPLLFGMQVALAALKRHASECFQWREWAVLPDLVAARKSPS
jgi:hypothetical protein